MTVQELINELQQYDQNLKVKVDNFGENLSLSEIFIDESENYLVPEKHETCLILGGSFLHKD